MDNKEAIAKVAKYGTWPRYGEDEEKAMKQVVHLAECWEEFREWHSKQVGKCLTWLDIAVKFTDLENPKPKDPLEELDTWARNRNSITIRPGNQDVDLIAKIAEIRGRK